MEWLKKYNFANKGLHKGFKVPENSLEAFKDSLLYDYAIKLDVRITKDKKIVVFSDKNLLRVCGSPKKISNLKYKDLKEYKLYNSKFTVPLLSEVLDFVNDKVPIIIEIKTKTKEEAFCESLCEVLDKYKGRFALCSYNANVLVWFDKYRHFYKKALMFGNTKKQKYPILSFISLYLKANFDFCMLEEKYAKKSFFKLCYFLKLEFIIFGIDTKKKCKKVDTKHNTIVFENLKI